MADDLRTSIIRIASELPKGDPTRRSLLASLQDKEAGGGELFWTTVDRRGFSKLRQEMKKAGDDQSAKLIDQIGRHLMRAMELSSNEQEALNRLNGCIRSVGRWDVDLQRNNLFKAANQLGINLPSAMF